MRKRLTAAIVVPTLLGGTAGMLAGTQVANAEIAPVFTVCKREVELPDGWACVESTRCVVYSSGYWQCSDGTSGGGERPGTEVPISPIER